MDVEVGGLYEADHWAVKIWPQYFVAYPATEADITAAAQALHADFVAATGNRELAYAEADRQAADKAREDAAAQHHAERGARQRFANFWNGVSDNGAEAA
jgi:hypothetical protein